MLDFCDTHWWTTAFFLAVFPRLTLLIGSFATGGLLWWLGWVFTPHLLVAILAIPFFDSNPVLVIFAWIMAIGGSGGEVTIVRNTIR